MATNLSQGVADLARQIALDQIAQDIKNNDTFAKKEDVQSQSEPESRIKRTRMATSQRRAA